MKRPTPPPESLANEETTRLSLLIQNLRRLRTLAGIPSDELAQRMGVAEHDLVEIEEGRRLPSMKLVYQIASALRDEFAAMQASLWTECLRDLQWKAGLPPKSSDGLN